MKNILILGASGSIAQNLVNHLKNENLIVAGRNYQNTNSSCRLDLSDVANVNLAIKHLKSFDFDYIFLNSGCFNKRRVNSLGLEENYMVNASSPFYLIFNLLKDKSNCRVIITSSISILKADFNLNPKNERHLYRNTKLYQYAYFRYLAEIDNKNKYIFVHPGITKSSLSNSLHSFFGNLFINYIAQKPDKAVRTLLAGLELDLKPDEWIVPGGLFNLFGEPKIQTVRLKKGFNVEFNIKKLEELYKQKE